MPRQYPLHVICYIRALVHIKQTIEVRNKSQNNTI
jgi:hypothetical protein